MSEDVQKTTAREEAARALAKLDTAVRRAQAEDDRYALRRLEDNLLRPDPTQKTTGWLPIETAPKDGTAVLLWNGGVCLGQWRDFQWYHSVDGEISQIGNYGIEWPSLSSWPTHWMPLPERPRDV